MKSFCLIILLVCQLFFNVHISKASSNDTIANSEKELLSTQQKILELGYVPLSIFQDNEISNFVFENIDNSAHYYTLSNNKFPEVITVKSNLIANNQGYNPSLWRGAGGEVFALSIDPLSDKFPTSSPYAAMGNNPVRFIDPDGKKIEFAEGTSQEYKDDFDKAIAYLDQHGLGKAEIAKLQTSDLTFYIGYDNSSYSAYLNLLGGSSAVGVLQFGRFINWSNKNALDFANGVRISPATILLDLLTYYSNIDYDKEFEYYPSVYYDFSDYYFYHEVLLFKIINITEQNTALRLGETFYGVHTRDNSFGIDYSNYFGEHYFIPQDVTSNVPLALNSTNAELHKPSLKYNDLFADIPKSTKTTYDIYKELPVTYRLKRAVEIKLNGMNSRRD